jgi:hypothetical protein
VLRRLLLRAARAQVQYAKEMDVIVDNKQNCCCDPFKARRQYEPYLLGFNMIYDKLVIGLEKASMVRISQHPGIQRTGKQ